MDEPLAYLAVKNSDIAEYISPNAASLIVSQIYFIKYCESNILHKIYLTKKWFSYCESNISHQICLNKRCFSYRESDYQTFIIVTVILQGVGVAMLSARLMAHTEIKYRHLGVLLFKVTILHLSSHCSSLTSSP